MKDWVELFLIHLVTFGLFSLGLSQWHGFFSPLTQNSTIAILYFSGIFGFILIIGDLFLLAKKFKGF